MNSAEPLGRQRPDPDALLRKVQAAEARAKRGRLKIWFGASPGVGKTYAMLESAWRASAAGANPLVGWIETHGRHETAQLLGDMPRLAPRAVDYRGRALQEFDLDAALARRPGWLLVDELAHTNAPGSRHAKRWQDVEELLQAGIDVDTTLNVQHLESLNDVVAQITGVRVAETLPDEVFERADEVELVDLPAELLIERLREGKVYRGEQAARAEAGFFKRGNLLALRELALRRVADRVGADVLAWREEHGIRRTWASAERILVCIGEDEDAPRLVRAGHRMASGLRAEWIAAHVETPADLVRSDAERERVLDALRLAESLGAEAQSLSGEDRAEAALDFARGRNVTRILVGKPHRRAWWQLWRASMLDRLLRESGEIEIVASAGDAPNSAEPPPRARGSRRALARDLGRAALVVGASTAVGYAMFDGLGLELTEVLMAYMLGIVFAATQYGRVPALFASALSVVLFDFCFVKPRHSFAVGDSRYVLTFVSLLVVGWVISTLTERVRGQAEFARERERRSTALYALVRDLGRAGDREAVAALAAQHLGAVCEGRVDVFLPDEHGGIALATPRGAEPPDVEPGVVRWVHDNGRPAGRGCETLPGARRHYLPLRSGARVLGVAATPGARELDDPAALLVVEALSEQTAVVLERMQLADDARRAELRARTEELRNSILSSISHDLRTPLASITGTASMLMTDGEKLPAMLRYDLAQGVFEEAERLNKLVGNVLDITRLDAGAMRIRKEWVPLDEVVGSALRRVERRLLGRAIELDLPQDLPLVPMDEVLIEQVLVNLLENALKYGAPATPIAVSARAEPDGVWVAVADRGPGVHGADREKVFERFFRGDSSGQDGVGLGLAICRGILAVHGGSIEHRERAGGGSEFRFRLPIEGAPAPPPSETAEPESQAR